MELRDYLRAFRRNWLMMVLVTLLMAGLSLAFTYTASSAPTYKATTRLFVSGWPASERDFNGVERLSATRVQSYAEVAAGDAMARRVVKRLGLSETPQQVASQISASIVPSTVILQISVVDPSAGRAQVLANTVAKELASFGTELETPPGDSRSSIGATVIDSAAEPSVTGGPQPLRSLVLGLLLGFFGGFGLVIVRESIRSEKAG